MRKGIVLGVLLLFLLLFSTLSAAPIFQNTSQANRTGNASAVVSSPSPNAGNGTSNLGNATANASASNLSSQPAAKAASFPCNSTADCKSGFCLNSTCSSPELANFVKGGPCNSTADCTEGFCQKGICLVPIPATAIFEFGAKPPCSPIIECSQGSFCFFACDFLWVLLFVFALGAGYISRKDRNRLIPVILFMLPLALGVYIYPVIGIMVGAVEMLIFFSKKPPEQQKEEDKAQPASSSLSTISSQSPTSPMQPMQPDLPDAPPPNTPI